MNGVRAFFRTEATECLDGLEQRLARTTSVHEAGELLRFARTLRGSAQMARDNETMTAARALENALRNIVKGATPWNESTADLIRKTVTELRALALNDEPDEVRDRRVETTVGRWLEPAPPAQRRSTPADEPMGEPASAQPTAQSDGDGNARIEFFVYAASEVSAILATLDRAIPALKRDPRDREALKQILRRQRALLGAATLDWVPDIAQTLRSIDEVCRLIARHDVDVTDEWLECFLAARDVLFDAANRLMEGGTPDQSPSLPKLLELRTRLFERFAEPEQPQHHTPRPEHQSAPLRVDTPSSESTPQQPIADTVSGPSPAIVPVDELLYRGEAALRRAHEIVAILERATADDPSVRDAVAELSELLDRIRT